MIPAKNDTMMGLKSLLMYSIKVNIMGASDIMNPGTNISKFIWDARETQTAAITIGLIFFMCFSPLRNPI